MVNTIFLVGQGKAHSPITKGKSDFEKLPRYIVSILCPLCFSCLKQTTRCMHQMNIFEAARVTREPEENQQAQVKNRFIIKANREILLDLADLISQQRSEADLIAAISQA